MNKILVTGTLFIHDAHLKQLAAKGYEVERLAKTRPTEAELKAAIKGKVGYILGSVEEFTDAVLQEADQLRAISTTATGWTARIPCWEQATSRGIAISSGQSANAPEVAEWGIAAMMAMQRDLFSLGPQGSETFSTVKSLMQLEVGIVGLGHIGREFAERATGLKARKVSYWSRQRKTDEYTYYPDIDDLLKAADVIFFAVGDEAGQDFITAERMELIKEGALVVSIVHKGIFNEDALFERVSKGQIRAAFDVVGDVERFRSLPPKNWYASNSGTAYNVESMFARASDRVTNSIINLLETGQDQYRVN